MALQNTVFTPTRRGPSLRDGAGGTSERHAARERDPVLRNVGAKTSDIRLTATGTDQSSGAGAMYNFGRVDHGSVGRYQMSAQSATGTGEPLGAVEFLEVDILETTAGVFDVTRVVQLEGLAGPQDASQTRTNIADAVLNMAGGTDFDGAAGDSDVSILVVDATQATDLVANGYTGVNAGDLIILECRSTTQEVWTVYRVN